MRTQVVTDAVKIKAAMKTGPATPADEQRGAVTASVPSSPTLPAPVATSPKSAVNAAVRTCLTTVSTAQKGKFVDRTKLLDVMLDLCRPEIEGMARDGFLADSATSLEKHRELAVAQALNAATGIVDGTL